MNHAETKLNEGHGKMIDGDQTIAGEQTMAMRITATPKWVQVVLLVLLLVLALVCLPVKAAPTSANDLSNETYHPPHAMRVT